MTTMSGYQLTIFSLVFNRRKKLIEVWNNMSEYILDELTL